MTSENRGKADEEFLRRLIARRPQDRERYEHLLRPHDETVELAVEGGAEAAAVDRQISRAIVLETIVDEQRPVLFVSNDRLDTQDVAIRGEEARELVERLSGAGERLKDLLPLVGRLDVTNFPGEFVGTGWFVTEDVVVTNRHVASLIARWDGREFAFNRGVAGKKIDSSLGTMHERDLPAADGRSFPVTEVLYIEPDSGPHDIAFVRVKRRASGNAPPFIPVSAADAGENVAVCAIGYPARASRSIIPDQVLMEELYRGRYDVKRVAPGFTIGTIEGTTQHDCTTLGGNSGSLLLDLDAQKAVGLHFAGLYHERNYAVRALVLTEYITRKRWNEPYVMERRPAAPPPAENPAIRKSSVSAVTPAADGAVSVTIPLTITVHLGTPATGADAPAARQPVDGPRAEAAARGYWRRRPHGVIAVRVGYADDGDQIGEEPCIAASVEPARFNEVAANSPREFDGITVRYLPAEVAEQLDVLPLTESVDSIAYDDDARTSQDFSFDPVDETMDLLLHVGPEYSWDTLKQFLGDAQGEIVSAMYEFHSPLIKDAIGARLEDGASLTLVLDNATFSKMKELDDEFERAPVFQDWADRYGDRFRRIVAPEGRSGLISDAYHIKVTVREDGKLWLSSGNWKMSSSQPLITPQQRSDSAENDLPGNREWHVVIHSATLARRFRSHILQDFQRSLDLGGTPVPKRPLREVLIDVPQEEAVVLERRPPSRLVPPVPLNGHRTKVRALLTPDRQGAVYSEAVLELIGSARKSLLFQIPYISIPSAPDADRGYLDDLLNALIRKLKTLPEARVILRTGSKAFSSPVHTAWYFKSKGVDVANRLRVIDNHHTKGMIVDGRKVLLGSHNWSKAGVTLNRDASLLFDDKTIAAYYAEAFEIDWTRSNVIRPKKFVKPETIVAEAAAAGPLPGYERVPLGELLTDG